MNLINIIYIPEIFINVIKEQAMLNENEIYGWLIGYQKENIPHVLAIIECKQFEQQSLISAIPHAQEFQELSSIMPQGIGPIGIFHSHPFSGEVFHSHTDDSTLLSLSNQFPQCVSIVTNGKDIKYYQMGRDCEVKEINVKYFDPEVPKFLLFSLELLFLIKINKSLLNKLDVRSLKVRISNEISDHIEKIWKDLELFTKSKKKISESDDITKYLVKELMEAPIQIKMKNNNIIQVFIKNSNDSNVKKESVQNDYHNLNLDFNIKIPIYITIENKKFSDLNQLLKAELVSNNIIQKLFNCVVDFENRRIITPEDYYFKFLGFFIRFLYFKEKKLNQNELSQKTYELVSKILSQFEPYINIDLSKEMKNQIMTIFKDIRNFSKNFNWYSNITENLKLIKKYYD